MADTPKIGPTGKFPFGKKLEPSDHGEIKAGVRVDHAKQMVYLEFGISVDWVALSKGNLKLFIDGLQDAYEELK